MRLVSIIPIFKDVKGLVMVVGWGILTELGEGGGWALSWGGFSVAIVHTRSYPPIEARVSLPHPFFLLGFTPTMWLAGQKDAYAIK